MDDWITLLKGDTHLYLEYNKDFTNNLDGYNIQIREKPEFEIRLDLSQNLRKRNRQTNTYYDARELADGAIAKLELLQLDHERILRDIARYLSNLPSKPDTWKLSLQLESDWSFVVTPEVKSFGQAHSLFLRVRECVSGIQR